MVQMTPEMMQAIQASAAQLGVSPADLFQVIGYETGGKFSTDVMGGEGGNYQGLIQFSPDNRKTYGIKKGMGFGEQMKSVTQYLKDRGVKPGHSLTHIYSAINAGQADKKYWGRSDDGGKTNILDHVAKMQKRFGPQAQQMFANIQPAGGAGPGGRAGGVGHPMAGGGLFKPGGRAGAADQLGVGGGFGPPPSPPTEVNVPLNTGSKNPLEALGGLLGGSGSRSPMGRQGSAGRGSYDDFSRGLKGTPMSLQEEMMKRQVQGNPANRMPVRSKPPVPTPPMGSAAGPPPMGGRDMIGRGQHGVGAGPGGQQMPPHIPAMNPNMGRQDTIGMGQHGVGAGSPKPGNLAQLMQMQGGGGPPQQMAGLMGGGGPDFLEELLGLFG